MLLGNMKSNCWSQDVGKSCPPDSVWTHTSPLHVAPFDCGAAPGAVAPPRVSDGRQIGRVRRNSLPRLPCAADRIRFVDWQRNAIFYRKNDLNEALLPASVMICDIFRF